jgi:hypothetical protein
VVGYIYSWVCPEAVGCNQLNNKYFLRHCHANRNGGINYLTDAHILIADFMRPNTSFLGQFLTALTMHHGLKFGIEDLPKLLENSQFSQITVLKERFLVIGFVLAIK